MWNSRSPLAFVLIWFVGFALVTGSPPARSEELESSPKVDFDQSIRPLLEKRCWSCHGPDKQVSNYRLDRKAAAMRGGDFGEPPIIAGRSDESALIRFVAGGGDVVMPPEGERLTAAEIALLRRWIDEGATWPESEPDASPAPAHWAFVPVERPLVPMVSSPTFPVRTPIDAFILETLRSSDLEPATEADRRTLIRRLYLDTLGLMPSPEEILQFVEDPAPDAYETLVERVLASPHFGERWARHWLDVVRFAESDGFETNQPRPNAWPYRDYVIRSFNDDKPYDQFIREQLAGDSLGIDEATGFLVGGPWDRVKSPDPVLTAQQRADELNDMVSTTGSVFLGLTVGCARCHSHKFDPVPQRDYYALTACFQGVQHGERPWRPADHAARQEKLAILRSELAPIDAQLAQCVTPAQTGRRILLDDDLAQSGLRPGPTARELAPPQAIAPHTSGTGRGQAGDPGDWNRLPNLGRSYRWWNNLPNTDLFVWKPGVGGRFRLWLSWGCGWASHTTSARYLLDQDGNLSTRDDQSEIAQVDQRRFADDVQSPAEQSLWSGFRAAGTVELTPETCIVLRTDETSRPTTADSILLEEVGVEEKSESSGMPAIRPPVQAGRNVERFEPVRAQFVRFTIQGTNQSEPCVDEFEVFTAGESPRNVALGANGAAVSASSSLPGYAIHQLAHVNDGQYGNNHSWISQEPGRGWLEIKLPQIELIDRVVWSRDREQPPKFEDRTATEYELAVSLDGKLWTIVASSRDRLPFSFSKSLAGMRTVTGVSTELQALAAKLSEQRTALEAKMQALTSSSMVYAGRFETPGATFRLHRGDPMQPREPVSPGTLTAFGTAIQLAPDCPEVDRRLALASWISDPRNPLTARVIVNRLWHHHFGQGIVSTPSDFGVNGGSPSHRELIDWLASELVQPTVSGVGQSQANAVSWSLKHIHRLILNSSTYRQSSVGNSQAHMVDASARLLWRFPPRRVEAETLRDAILTVSEKLDRTLGGPGFDLFEPNTNYVKVYNSKREFGPETFRRMVYQAKPRMQLDETFGPFDCPDAGQITPRRNRSTTPLQALNLLNSPFILQQSELFAERVRREAGEQPEKQVDRAFMLAFGRPAAPDELTAAVRLVSEHGLPALCRALFNAHEFVTLY